MKPARKKPRGVRRETELWWVSWEEWASPADSGPLRHPPGDSIVAWWESGLASDESYAIMAALVVAGSERSLNRIINKDWPDPKRERRWRFRELHQGKVLTIGDRFPFKKWSIERLEKLGIPFDVTPVKGEE